MNKLQEKLFQKLEAAGRTDIVQAIRRIESNELSDSDKELLVKLRQEVIPTAFVPSERIRQSIMVHSKGRTRGYIDPWGADD